MAENFQGGTQLGLMKATLKASYVNIQWIGMKFDHG